MLSRWMTLNNAWSFLIFSFLIWKMGLLGFPGGPVVKNPPCNARDAGSIPYLEKSHMPLGPWATTTEPRKHSLWSPCALERVLCNKRGHCNEKPERSNKDPSQPKNKISKSFLKNGAITSTYLNGAILFPLCASRCFAHWKCKRLTRHVKSLSSQSRHFSGRCGGTDPGIELRSPALQADSFPSEPPGNPSVNISNIIKQIYISKYVASLVAQMVKKKKKKNLPAMQ